MNRVIQMGHYSLYFFSLGFLSFGLLFLVAPASLMTLVEIPLSSPIAVMELRAVYGGFFFGAGFFLMVCARRESWLRPGLAAQASMMGGLVAGRVLSLIAQGAANPFQWLLFLSEIIGLIISVAALRKFAVPRTQDS